MWLYPLAFLPRIRQFRHLVSLELSGTYKQLIFIIFINTSVLWHFSNSNQGQSLNCLVLLHSLIWQKSARAIGRRSFPFSALLFLMLSFFRRCPGFLSRHHHPSLVD